MFRPCSTIFRSVPSQPLVIQSCSPHQAATWTSRAHTTRAPDTGNRTYSGSHHQNCNKRPAHTSRIATPAKHTLMLQDQPTQKKGDQSQRQHQHRNIRSAIQTSRNKKIQPGSPRIPNISLFFNAFFYSNLNYMYKTLTLRLPDKISLAI